MILMRPRPSGSARPAFLTLERRLRDQDVPVLDELGYRIGRTSQQRAGWRASTSASVMRMTSAR